MKSQLDLLFHAMDGLKPEQLKRFHVYLSNRSLDGFEPMPRSRLGDCDSTDTVAAMMEVYRIEGALRITVQILRKIYRSDLADELEKGMNEVPSQEEQATDAPETDTVLPEPSHAMKSDFPKIQPQSSLSQPQQSTPDRISQVSGGFTDEPLNKHKYDDEKSRVMKEYSGGASAEKEIESISNRSVVPQVITPESNPNNYRKSYRLPCSSEGLFQCRYTGLVFKMDTEGEVEYRTEPWNYTQLANRKYVPAGTLFNITCLRGTLSQIRFPHCEVNSGKGIESFSLTCKFMHIRDSGEYEMLDPHDTTDSYMSLNISGCSKYGLIKRQPKKKYSPIKGLVLLFLHEATLNVLLLPRNVDISKVFEERRKMKEPTVEIYIETNTNCELVPENTYYLSSDPEEHAIFPSGATILDYENYNNYIATFQVFLTKFGRVKLNLKGKGSDECVWYSDLEFQADLIGRRPSVPSPSSPYTPQCQDFFHKHKAALEARLGLLTPILSELEKCGVLSPQEREEVESVESIPKQNQSLLLILEKKGGPAQEEFYRVLKKCDEYLVKNLEGPYRTHETKCVSSLKSLHSARSGLLPQTQVFSPSSPYTPPGQDFFHKHKAALETRLGLLRPILSELEKCGVLSPQEREEVESVESIPKQNQSLLLILEKKGGPAQEEFYRVLKKCDEYLVKNLEGPYRTHETKW